MSFKISASPTFERDLKWLSKKYPSLKSDLIDFSKSIIENPFQGDSLRKDCYKVQMKITPKGKGKSGGSRVIACVKVINEHIKLLTIYDKSEQGTVSDSFLMQLLHESGLI